MKSCFILPTYFWVAQWHQRYLKLHSFFNHSDFILFALKRNVLSLSGAKRLNFSVNNNKCLFFYLKTSYFSLILIKAFERAKTLKDQWKKIKCFFLFTCPRGILFFLTFPACFKIPIFFSNLNSNCSNLLDLRNLQEQVKKSILLPKFFLTFHCPNQLF